MGDIYGTEAWASRISDQELPALASTVRTLEKLQKSDSASLSALGQSILHDHALTSRILRAVNSVCYSRGRNQVTTVSRAAVILGFDTLKHICITAKMMDSLLRNRDISRSVHHRLLRLMAESLHAGMLARMMVEEYDDDTKEEVYIAALLHNIGEVAFWSMGGTVAEALDKKIVASGDEVGVVKEQLGTSFEQLSAALAHSWHMGEVLVHSMTDASRRTPELKAVFLANKLSSLMIDEQSSAVELGQRLNEIADLMQIPVFQLKKKIRTCTRDTAQLAGSYGAHSLVPLLDAGAKGLAKSSEVFVEELPAFPEPNEALQLKALRELTQLTLERQDLNLLMHTALEGIHRGVGMDRTVVLMPDLRRTKLLPRFFSGNDAGFIKQHFQFPLTGAETLFTQVYKTMEPLWVKDVNAAEWRMLFNASIRGATSDRPFFVAALVFEGRAAGLFYADRAESGRNLLADDFAAFVHFVQQTSLCLSMIKQRN